MKHIFVVMMAFCALFQLSAQSRSEWQPTGEWPFVNQRFLPATVYTGFFSLKKTVVPCNIHLGNQTLWYVQNDTLMEANPCTVVRVEFSDSTVYVPVTTSLMGKVVREDSLNGKLARVIQVIEVDQGEVDRRGRAATEMTSGMLQGGGLLSSLAARIADVNAGEREEELPIPLKNSFYFLYNNELFEVSDKNILKRIDQSRRREYRNFTRSAEIISENLTSVLKIWETFFVNY